MKAEGLLFTKDHIFINPDDETPVRKFGRLLAGTNPTHPTAPHIAWPEDKPGDKGHTHAALVRRTDTTSSPKLDPVYEL